MKRSIRATLMECKVKKPPCEEIFVTWTLVKERKKRSEVKRSPELSRSANPSTMSVRRSEHERKHTELHAMNRHHLILLQLCIKFAKRNRWPSNATKTCASMLVFYRSDHVRIGT